MKLYKYKSHKEYISNQIETNKRKLDRVSAEESIIKIISNYIKDNIPNPIFGICHGVRNAWEVQKFRHLNKFNIIGTDISPTVTQFKNTIQWDFHEVKDEWINNVDFIYSNSLDHSYDPESCLSKWISCLSEKGLCFIEWSIMCNVPKKGLSAMKADCFGADLDEYREMILKKNKIKDELKIKLDTKWVKKRGMINERTIFVIGET